MFLNADEVAAKIGDKLGIEAGKILMEKIADSLNDGKSVAMESTISGNYHIRVIDRFRAKKYKIVLIYVFLDSIELNLARIKKRVLLGGHDIPEEYVRRRASRSFGKFWDIKKIADQWELYYNGNNTYKLIARGAHGIEEVVDRKIYKKFKAMKNE